MRDDADIIVIGGGTMGAAAALALARRGRRVIVLDRFDPPHIRGEHHGDRRMFRTSYYEHPDYVPLLRKAATGWHTLESETGIALFDEVGACYLGPADGELISGSLMAAQRHAIPHRLLSAKALARELLALTPPQGSAGMLEPTAGFVRCEAAVRAMLDRAKRLQAEVRVKQRVKGWSADASGVRVETAQGVLRAGAMVIATGPGSGALLRGSGVKLTVTRQLQGWARPSAGTGVPNCCWAIEMPGGGLFYGFPVDLATGEFKFGLHVRGRTTGALESGAVTGAELRAHRGALNEFMREPCTDLRLSVCRYTNSPDSHFIIDRHPLHPNVVFGAGFSGHGFKFAPAIGDLLRDLVLDSHSPHPAPFLSLDRFRGES